MKNITNEFFWGQYFISALLFLLFKDTLAILSFLLLVTSPITGFITNKIRENKKIKNKKKEIKNIINFEEEKKKLEDKKNKELEEKRRLEEKEEMNRMLEEITSLTKELIIKDSSKSKEDRVRDKYKDQTIVNLNSYKKDLYETYNLTETKFKINDQINQVIFDNEYYYPKLLLSTNEYNDLFDIIYEYFKLEGKEDLYYKAMHNLFHRVVFYNGKVNDISMDLINKVLLEQLIVYLTRDHIKLIELRIKKMGYINYLETNNLENNDKVLYLDYFRRG